MAKRFTNSRWHGVRATIHTQIKEWNLRLSWKPALQIEFMRTLKPFCYAVMSIQV
jgi:hypothetical protein